MKNISTRVVDVSSVSMLAHAVVIVYCDVFCFTLDYRTFIESSMHAYNKICRSWQKQMSRKLVTLKIALFIIKTKTKKKPMFLRCPRLDTSVVLTEDTDSFKIGDRVWVGGTKPGTIAYIGETKFAPGDWAGVVLDEPIGKANRSSS